MASRDITRRGALILGLTTTAGLLAACNTTSVLETGSGKASDQTAPSLPIVNAERQKRGLPPLSIDRAAQAAALVQARRMAKAGEMKHLIGFRDNFAKRVKASDVKLPAAENIAAGQATAEAAMDAWIRSPSHMRNMMGSFTGVGVAVAYDAASGDRPYWAMILSN